MSVDGVPSPAYRPAIANRASTWHCSPINLPTKPNTPSSAKKPPPPTLLGKKPRPETRIILWIVVLGTLALNYYAGSWATKPATRIRVPYSPFFLNEIQKGHVSAITSKGTAIQGSFKTAEAYNGSKASTLFQTEIPAFANTNGLAALLEKNKVVVNAQPLTSNIPRWESLLLGFGPSLLLIGLLIYISRRAGNVQGMLGAFGRSKARRYEPAGDPVTFADVAGIDEAKAELSEVVDFLRQPGKYEKLGGRVPHGVLLSGPPGTGKTLLARAVAGEAGAPFFSMSASEFVEAIVGIGASRVRDLFKQAKEAAPAIIFIDELDAIGRSRSAGAAGFSGGNDEREQTLNQILTEMDGFDSSTGVIVIAATNRPDVLDAALLRPGRFDRRVAVQPPDRLGRQKILEVHTKNVPLAPAVDLSRIASATPGMVGADLANLVNEAALLAARRNHELVNESDFTDAMERIILGAERQVMISREDRARTAYHEGGHAIVGMLTEGADPVRKISIIPRGMALGVTFSAPDADRFNYTRRELIAKIKVALGGRAAEEVVYGDASTGAESDIQQLTQIARGMVGRWGMSSEIGPLSALPPDGGYFPGASEMSARSLDLIDSEVRKIVDEAHTEVVALLKEHREKLDSLAEALLEHETLDEDAAYAAAQVPHTSSADERELAAALLDKPPA